MSTSLTKDQVRRVRRCFEWFRPCGPALVAQACRRCAERDADIATMLQLCEHPEMYQKLFSTLDHILRNAMAYQTLEQPLLHLGERAAKMGVRPEQLTLMRDSLIESIQQLVGDEWNRELYDAWILLLDSVTGSMILGMLDQGGQTRRLAA